MNILKRFGSYEFPSTQINYFDNFAELVTRTSRLPGAHGGFDELGDERGLSEVGTIRAEFWLHFDSIVDATAKLDALRKITDSGRQLLYMKPIGAAERFCWVRVDDIQSPHSVRDMPHKRMKVKVTFQASDPFWCATVSGGAAVWGGFDWGDGTLWGGSVTTVTGSTTLTITNNGNAFTYPKISLTVPAGKVCLDPIIRRVVNGEVVDEIAFFGELTAGDRLYIVPQRGAVYLNDVSAYDHRFSVKTPYWMRLLPGSNSIQIRFAQTTDQANVAFPYLERFV